MKKAYLFICIGLFITICGKSQDLIIKNNKDTIKAIVISLTTNEIEYKKFSDQNGLTYSLPTNDVEKIKYQDGREKIIKKNNPTETAISKNDLWKDNSQNFDKASKPKKPKTTKPIFNFGLRLLFFDYKPGIERTIIAIGPGVGLSIPLVNKEKAFNGDVKGCLAIDGKLNLAIIDESISGVKDISGEKITGFISLDYRIKLGQKAFLAPSFGIALNLNDIINDDYYSYYSTSNDDDTAFKVGLQTGMDIVLSHFIIEFKYDFVDEAKMLGIGLNF